MTTTPPTRSLATLYRIARLLQDHPAHRHLHAISPDLGQTSRWTGWGGFTAERRSQASRRLSLGPFPHQANWDHRPYRTPGAECILDAEPFKTRFCIQPPLGDTIMTESTEKKTVAERAADLSDEVLESVGARQQAAIEAVRKFVDTLDEAMPNLVDPELRKKILDAALDLAEQLATSTNEFLRSIGRSASETLKK
jgi:hypothetical protein